MAVFLAAGAILGVLARVLRHDADDPGVPVALALKVAAAAVGGPA